MQNFRYLRSCVDGSVSQIIRSIEFGAKNYNIAWDMLCKRFDNEWLLSRNHINGIFNVEPVGYELARNLRFLTETLNNHLKALTKTLGLNWNCDEDILYYMVDSSEYTIITKRTMLSEISQIFDPLRLVSSCVIVKIMLQRLWLLNCPGMMQFQTN